MDAAILPLAVAVLNLPGPAFLALYAGLVLVAVFVLTLHRTRADDTRYEPPPVLPMELDARFLAWLRGGRAELVRLTGLELLQRKLLKLTPDGKMVRDPQMAMAPDLSPEAVVLLEKVKQAANGRQLVQTGVEVMAAQDARFQELAQTQRLVNTPQNTARARKLCLLFTVALLGLGLAKIIHALNPGHSNIEFLIILMIGTPLAIWTAGPLPRLSALGRAYLARARQALAPLPRDAAQFIAAGDPMLVLAAGAFGLGVLNATDYAPYQRHLSPSGSGGTSSSCGSSCSSSCSSGGGGSSCGGGGCGGCGGGGD